MAYSSDKLYVATGYAGGNKVVVYNNNLSVFNANFAGSAAITTPYGIAADPQNGDIWVTDAVDFTTAGKVLRFGSNGALKNQASVSPGVNPGAIAFAAQ